MRTLPADLIDRIRPVKLLILDVDGVLTDGRIIYGNFGDELKFFNAHDGLGITLLQKAGIETVLLTGRKSKVVHLRARDLHVSDHYYTADKGQMFDKILRRRRLNPEEVCFVGDDLIDAPVLRKAGFAVTVANAVQEVKDISHYTTDHRGGAGAVREVCDLILKTQGKWTAVTGNYFL